MRYRGPDRKEHSETFARRSDADGYLSDQEASIRRDQWIDPKAAKIPLEDFATRWLATIVHLRPSTRRRYESLLRVHIVPALGEYPIASIGRLDVRAFLSGMQEKGFAPTTTRHAFTLLKEILGAAQLEGFIGRSPAAGVRAPARPRHEQRFLSAKEVALLADSIRPRYRAFVLTGAYGALRWGELAGLRVGRLRLLERRVDVVETVVEVGNDLVWGPPKTGERTVSIPKPVARELSEHLRRFPPGSDGLVFSSVGGGPLRHGNFYRREWVPALEAAKLEMMRIHDLRHTAVALAIRAGAHPKEIQELCGHRSITTTLNVYGHLFEGLQDRLADRLAQAYRQGTREARAASLRPEEDQKVVQLKRSARN